MKNVVKMFALGLMMSTSLMGCGGGSETNASAQNTMGPNRTYQGAATDFSGRYSGNVSLTASDGSVIPGTLNLTVNQDTGAIQSVMISLVVNHQAQSIYIPAHDIRGNALFDTTTDLSQVGSIDGNGFFIKRDSSLLAVDRTANGIHVSFNLDGAYSGVGDLTKN
jgi:hypothetical protein